MSVAPEPMAGTTGGPRAVRGRAWGWWALGTALALPVCLLATYVLVLSAWTPPGDGSNGVAGLRPVLLALAGVSGALALAAVGFAGAAIYHRRAPIAGVAALVLVGCLALLLML